MSKENVDIVHAALRAFNQRDRAGFDVLLATEAEIIPARAAIESVAYRGSDAGSQYCNAVDERWENLRWEVDEIRDGGDWVLALGHIVGRGRDSGAAIDARGAWLAKLRGGQITHFQTFSDRAAALKAAGLEQ
jgi:ketosteroid isomerase-like protein